MSSDFLLGGFCAIINRGMAKSRKQRRRSFSPEPGAWVVDRVAGMPEIGLPGELPAGKLSVSDVQDQVAYEGLGYCLYDLIDPKRIKDPKLSRLWAIARKHIREVLVYLERSSLLEKRKRRRTPTKRAVRKTRHTAVVENIGGEVIDEVDE